MNKITLVCQNCSGTLEVGTEQNVLCCPYCGQKTLVPESDEVKIARMQTNTEKETTFSKNRTKVTIGGMIAFVLILLLLIFKDNDMLLIYLFAGGLWAGVFFVLNKDNKKTAIESAMRKKPILNGIRMPISSDDAVEKDYSQVADILKSAGFINVQTLQKRRGNESKLDKWMDSTGKDCVESITVNGLDYFEVGDYFLPDAYIVITYVD